MISKRFKDLINYTEHLQQQLMNDMLMKVICLYVAVTLGVPGNILSAVVWIRRRQTSSAVYLAALAINDLSYLLVELLSHIVNCVNAWLCLFSAITTPFTMILEPLLVLGFSIERLIAIVRPLQVCCPMY